MKKYIFIVLMAVTLSVHSQNLFDIRVSSEEVSALKETTTLFVLPISNSGGIDEDARDVYTKQIAEVWEITPFEVIAPSEKKNFDNSKYSFFEVIELGVNQTEGVGFNFQLSYLGKVKGKKINLGHFKLPYFLQPCWTLAPGILKPLLKSFNDELEIAASKKSHDFFGDKEDLADLAHLKTETLYIPETVFDKLIKTGYVVELPEKGKLENAYPHNYKIVSVKELSDLIISGEVTYFLIDFNDSGFRRFNIVNAKTGRVISGRISGGADVFGAGSNSYNFTYFQKLNKKIK